MKMPDKIIKSRFVILFSAAFCGDPRAESHVSKAMADSLAHYKQEKCSFSGVRGRPARATPRVPWVRRRVVIFNF
jgi:hypothetical protein